MVRNRSRRLGRILPRCAVGTTLLVKGLEFDHAVVLDTDAYDARNLYVALTRGAKSLTVTSRHRSLYPVPFGVRFVTGRCKKPAIMRGGMPTDSQGRALDTPIHHPLVRLT